MTRINFIVLFVTYSVYFVELACDRVFLLLDNLPVSVSKEETVEFYVSFKGRMSVCPLQCFAGGSGPRRSKTQLCLYVYCEAEIGGFGFPCFNFTTEQVLNYMVKRGGSLVKRVEFTLWECRQDLWCSSEHRDDLKSVDLVKHHLKEALDRKIKGFVLSKHHWGPRGSTPHYMQTKYTKHSDHSSTQ